MKKLSKLIEERPLFVLLMGALAIRLLAVVFSRGYMASDDHHQVVEIAAQWLRGNMVHLSGGGQFYRSLLFPGAHWVLMKLSHTVGITHPDLVLGLVRLALALFSLWTVAITYKYGTRLGGARVGWAAGWLVAAHVLMPYVSVRNLVETGSMPFLLYSLYRLHCTKDDPSDRSGAILAGLSFGLALVIRTQVLSAGLGIAAYLLWQKEFRTFALWAIGTSLPLIAQGAWDMTLHGTFLGSVVVYLQHNRAHVFDYVTGPFYRYFLLIPGMFLPPFGLLFVAAMFRSIRKQGVLFWSVVVFVVFHSLVPQKQERFMLPIFPELALMGCLGLSVWAREHGDRFRLWIRRGWRFFWILNLPLMVLAATHYGQKARIEPLIRLYELGDAQGIVADMTERAPGLPRYYIDGGVPGRGIPPIYEIRETAQFDSLRTELESAVSRPNYIIIFSAGRLDEHVAEIEERLTEVEIIMHSEPNPIDRALRFLNPEHNHSKESWLGALHWPAED